MLRHFSDEGSRFPNRMFLASGKRDSSLQCSAKRNIIAQNDIKEEQSLVILRSEATKDLIWQEQRLLKLTNKGSGVVPNAHIIFNMSDLLERLSNYPRCTGNRPVAHSIG